MTPSPVPFTDYLGNPINAGDTVVYPTASGSSSATMNLAVVDSIDPIIESPDGRGHIHESQLSKPDPTTVSYPTRRWHEDGEWKSERLPHLAYRIAVKKLRDGTRTWGALKDENPERRFYVTNIDRVVVVTSLAVKAREDARNAQLAATLETRS